MFAGTIAETSVNETNACDDDFGCTQDCIEIHDDPTRIGDCEDLGYRGKWCFCRRRGVSKSDEFKRSDDKI